MTRLNLFPKQNNPYVAKQITEILQHFIDHQYKTQLYPIIQMSVHLQVFILLVTLL